VRLAIDYVMLGCMSQTTIDVNEELVAEVMRVYGLTSIEEVVDLALRRLAGPPLSKELFADLDEQLAELDDLPSPELPDLS
jgi:Arc/MetJ family transcription regulator